MEYIKIFGLERSGTNYLQKILQNNYDDTEILVNILGFKHGVFNNTPDVNGIRWHHLFKRSSKEFKKHKDTAKFKDILNNIDNIKYCFVYKNPYSYIVSMLRFDKCKYLDISRDTISIRNLILRWNHTVRSYLDVVGSDKKYFMYNYEDYIANEQELIENISINLDIEHNSRFEGIENVMFAGCSENTRILDNKFDISYYTEQKYLEELDNKEVDLINEYLDKELLKTLGISIVVI